MQIEHFQLIGLLADAAELGASRALEKTGKLSPMISKAEAYRLYGRKQVDRWIMENLLKPIQDGSRTKVRFERQRLETIAKASNRISYLQ